MAQKTTTPASFGEILLLQKGEKQKLFYCQNGSRNPMEQFNVEVTNMLPTIGAKHNIACFLCRSTITPRGEKQKFFCCKGKYYCCKKVKSRNSFTVRLERQILWNSLTSKLQTCYQQLPQNTISPASFPEAPLLQKCEKQKFFHCQK